MTRPNHFEISMSEEFEQEKNKSSGSSVCSNAHPEVNGRCPCCGNASLFLGEGGFVTCSIAECNKPDAANDMLEGWAGTPIYTQASKVSDGSGRVFHRDHAGSIVAEFSDAKDAELFTEFFGENSGWRKNGDERGR